LVIEENIYSENFLTNFVVCASGKSHVCNSWALGDHKARQGTMGAGFALAVVGIRA
jgi:hypothetical protein